MGAHGAPWGPHGVSMRGAPPGQVTLVIPYSLRGAGKVETIRELARVAAMPTFEVVGQDAFDYEMMLQIVRGLISFGAWGLFN